MKTLLAFITPLMLLIPTVFAIVGQLKKALPKTLPAVYTLAVSMVVGIAFTMVADYLVVVDGGSPFPLGVVLIAGVLVGGGASGLFDFGKLVGALGSKK